MQNQYLEVIGHLERLHRQFLEVVKNELEHLGVHDISSVQALLLFNIGEAEITVGELTTRGYYLGSNVSYNVRKMVENGYLIQERSAHDRRLQRIHLPDKGLALYRKLDEVFRRHVEYLESEFDLTGELVAANKALGRLERFWISVMNLGGRPRPPPAAD